MNDGFLTLIIGFIFFFLFLGDWFREETEVRSWKTGQVCQVLFLMMLSPFLSAELFGVQVTLAMVVLPFLSLHFMYRLPKREAFHLMAGSLLIGSVYFLLQELFLMDPVLLIADPRVMSGSIISLLCGLFHISLPEKWMTVLFGLPAGWLFFNLFHLDQIPLVQLGSFYHMDELFITLLSLSAMHFLLQKLMPARRFSFKKRLKDAKQRGAFS